MQQFHQRLPITEQIEQKQFASPTDTAQSDDGESELKTTSRRGEKQLRTRQGVMYVHIEHFYCTLEETIDPELRGRSFVVGTGTGRPNEPGRVIDVSLAAARLGLQAGMPLRRAHRIAPHTRFLPASYDRYQPVLQKLKERYHAYSRIVESIPISDAFIDLQGSELSFETPAEAGEKLCDEISKLGLQTQIGIANGKTIAELAALMSRREGRQGVLYIPLEREASFVQSLPLSILLQLHATTSIAENSNESDAYGNHAGNERGTGVQLDPTTLEELVAHLKDFGITTFFQVASLAEEGLVRRLGIPGGWLFQISQGNDDSLVIPDAPPQSQNARVRFHHLADADETCSAIRRLADYLGERLRTQRLKGRSIALILWPQRLQHETRHLLAEDGSEIEQSDAEETIGGQMLLEYHTDEEDIIAHHALMLFAHYHRSGTRYTQVQLRIGEIVTAIPNHYYPPAARSRSRLTRKL